MPTEKIKRPLIAHFLDTSGGADWSGATWERLGVNVTEAATEYNAQTESEQDIVSDSATTEITGYQAAMSISQQCTKGDPVFTYVTGLRRRRATMAESHTWLLNVDLWDVDEGNRYQAEVQEVAVQIDSYGGAGGEAPVLGYTLHYAGDPIPGTVTMEAGRPTFARAE